MRLIVTLLAVLCSNFATAQVRPQPGSGDPRIQMVEYSPEQVVQLQTAPGYQLTIEFGDGERIENVALGDSAAWQVTPNKRGDHLFVKPIQPGVTTNMVVVTDARIYAFELSPLYGAVPDMAYTVRFKYPVPATAVETPAPEIGRYRLSGASELRPSNISDDGQRTFIIWPVERTLPAAYIVDPEGRETLANGMMRDGILVVDTVAQQLIFRLDRRTAKAERMPQSKARR